MKWALVIAASLAAGAAAAAPSEAPPPPATTVSPATATAPPASTLTYAPPKAADQKDDQLVCQSQAVLGSRLPVRRCRTVADIKDRQRNDREMVEHAQSNLQIRSN
ncbi:hypothetical protein [Phenylobacterium sp.]|uniref:hypothetical protein n=1 Tax=Phenylobacterium sp. TaxID=1871053 RepID=UPI003565E39C